MIFSFTRNTIQQKLFPFLKCLCRTPRSVSSWRRMLPSEEELVLFIPGLSARALDNIYSFPLGNTFNYSNRPAGLVGQYFGTGLFRIPAFQTAVSLILWSGRRDPQRTSAPGVMGVALSKGRGLALQSTFLERNIKLFCKSTKATDKYTEPVGTSALFKTVSLYFSIFRCQCIYAYARRKQQQNPFSESKHRKRESSRNQFLLSAQNPF